MINLLKYKKLKKKLLILVALLFLTVTSNARADSPLTSTPFYKEYLDNEIVVKAENTKMIDQEIADYLHDTSNPMDIKAAVINALGWDVTGRLNYNIYCGMIHGKLLDESDLNILNPNELFVLGYLKAMDNYFEPKPAVPFLNKAKDDMSNSFTVAMIDALVKGQETMSTDFCNVWKLSEGVFDNASLEKDMRESAKKIIYDYVVIYKNDCK